MSLGKRLINTGAAAAAACPTESVQAFGADSAFSSNIALYQLDGNANDTTGDYNGTASNVTYTTGQFGNAAVFNGSSSYISTGISIDSYSERSYSFWFKQNSNTGDSRIFGGVNGSATNGGMLRVREDNGNINYHSINNTLYTFTTTLTNDVWTHIALTDDGTTAKLYVNGSEITNTSTASYTSVTNTNLQIGRGKKNTGAIGDYTNGSIDQVRIFNRQITAEEVSTLYNETSSTASNTNPLSDGSGVALYSLDYDASDAGGLYDGTPTNVDFGVGGKINYGARFNGSSSYISGLPTITNSGALSNSISLWFRRNGNPSALETLFGETSDDSVGGSDSVFTLYINTDGTLELIYRQTSPTGQPTITIRTTSTYTDDNWYNVVCTLDSSEIKLFVNGEEDASSPTTIIGTATLPDQYIGAINNRGTAVNFFNGSIDQVRIFSKVLNQNEIDALFAETACVHTSTTDIVNYPTGTTPVAYYKLDNSSEDYVGSNDGTDTNVEYRFGRFGQAAVFSANGYISGLPTVENTSGEFSVSLWFNTTVNPSVQHTMLGGIKEQGTNDSVVALKMTSDGYSKLYVRGTDGTLHILADTVDATDGNWHHLVGTVNSSSAILYVDGSQVDTATISNNITVDNLLIGAENNRATLNPTNYFNGKIDQVRIYDAALTSSQVTELYNEKPEVDTSNFKTVLYEGTGVTQYISNVGIDLETNGGLVWTKSRDNAYDHNWVDSVRGINTNGTLFALSSNLTGAQTDSVNNVLSLDANGFTVQNAGSRTNTNNQNYVSWVWKGGGDAVPNEDGDITSQVSANTDAGFSIVKWNSSSTSSDTIGSGLNERVEFLITKTFDYSRSWIVWHKDLPNNGYLILNSDANETTPNGNRATVTNDNTFIAAGFNPSIRVDSMIAYCWHSVAGYSKIGTYEGLGTSTVTVSGLGFKPSWIIVKNADDTANWNIYDSRRSGNDSGWSAMDTMNDILYPNLNIAEVEGGTTHVFTANSDGFVVGASNHLQNNKAGDTFIYMAFK